MITEQELIETRKRTLHVFERAGIILTSDEFSRIEVADFGLGDLTNIGLQLVVFVNTSRVCCKEMVLFPWQTCPEHRHPAVGSSPGKEETFRCRAGLVYLYVDRNPNSAPKLHHLENYREYLQVAHEIVLRPGEQYTLEPDLLHWFRAGSEGAIISEFSTPSTDELDIFTDPRIERITKIASNLGH